MDLALFFLLILFITVVVMVFVTAPTGSTPREAIGEALGSIRYTLIDLFARLGRREPRPGAGLTVHEQDTDHIKWRLGLDRPMDTAPAPAAPPVAAVAPALEAAPVATAAAMAAAASEDAPAPPPVAAPDQKVAPVRQVKRRRVAPAPRPVRACGSGGTHPWPCSSWPP